MSHRNPCLPPLVVFAFAGFVTLPSSALAATSVDVGWVIDSLAPFVETALIAVASALVGWLASRLSRWIGLEIDRDHAEALQGAIARGVRHAVSLVKTEAREHTTIDIESRLIAETAIYLEQLMPDALDHFVLTDDALDRLIRAHLGPDVLHWATEPEPAQ
ncbi:MAG: hypothetical protein ACFB01_13705 [Cohaesibacteraceae bacterium]